MSVQTTAMSDDKATVSNLSPSIQITSFTSNKSAFFLKLPNLLFQMTLTRLFLASLASCGWNALERAYRSSSAMEGAPNLEMLQFVPSSSAEI